MSQRTPGDPLRTAIMGAGQMARHHAHALSRLEEPARLQAIVDPDTEAREALAEEHPDAGRFATLEEALTVAPLDVIHVCTPPPTHAPLARQALGAGCHVYVEKPFAMSATEAREILDLARARGLHCCAGHQLLFESPTRRAQELLPALGDLVHVESYFSFRQVRTGRDGRPALPADMQLLDILPHPVYLLLAFLEDAAPYGRTALQHLEIGGSGTVHALVGRGGLTASLVVTLVGRPVESYVRLVGSNGSVQADYVRGTVQRLVGPGISGIDKALQPYRLARQLLGGTSAALGRRVLRRQKGYPGLLEIFEAFYSAIRASGPPALMPENILETVRICERIGSALHQLPGAHTVSARTQESPGPRVLVTGGTGFLGAEVVRALVKRGESVRVLSRRLPSPWERVLGVEYIPVDLAEACPEEHLSGAKCIVHCAAETAGGWEEHRRNSLEAVNNLLRAADRADVRRIVHVSSLAVLGPSSNGRAVDERTPLEADSRGSGPYVWGKLESERKALEIGGKLGLEVKVVRPGALVDYGRLEPPGRLGRRVGNIFVAVGRSNERLGVADVSFAGRTLAWIATHFGEAPKVLNLLAPELPDKGELVRLLRARNPYLRVVWLPRFVIRPMSWAAIALQKALRPRQPAINLYSVFSKRDYDTSRIRELARRFESQQNQDGP